ncbi:MAG TPA: carboxypeptidase-like regulatory domain-containing protein [Acidobacteriaceae bacterium]|nr:carboxypeptidase-like regulatory domain-containing protein [Acidobacteriaceae bacterium]
MARFSTVGALLAILTALCAAAQTPGTGAISGTVFDPAHRVIAGADVSALDLSTHTARTAKTGPEGDFRIALLPPGDYSLTITAAGFAAGTIGSVQVAAGEVRSLEATLSVEKATTEVKVSASQQIVDLESSTLGSLVDRRTIDSLPLANHNFTQILGLSPGVVVDLPNAAQPGSGTQNVASNGATPTANNIQFNGVDANNLVENSAATAGTSEVGVAIPAVDTIQEFRVQTANFDAAYGRGSGANVDLVSRGGTNSLHGSAWEFVRNNIFNANDFFSKLANQKRPDLKQNQFGAALGGPIRRDRAFFFAAYQGLTEVNGFGDEQTPILPRLTSDRSAATLGAQFCPAGHLNTSGQPAAGYFTAAGGTQVACDGSNINPVALAILNAKLPNGQFAIPNPQIPLPPSGPNASDQMPIGESTFAFPTRYREDQATLNLDQVLSRRNTLAERFFYSRAPLHLPFAFPAANLPGWGTDALSRNTMFVITDTHAFSSALTNIARFGYTRFDGVSHIQHPLAADAVGEGVPTGPAHATQNIPGLIVGGFGGFSIGDAGTPFQWEVTNTFIWQDTFALTRRNHNMRFGVEFKRHEIAEEQPFSVDGVLLIATFQDFLLGESAAQNGSPFGLSNVTVSNAGGGIYRRNERFTDFAGFAEDDIRVTHRLVVTTGVRYEIFDAPIETNGRFANFNLQTAQQGPLPAQGTFSGLTLPSNYRGPLPAQVTRTSFPGLYRTPHGDVSPRLGFALQLTDRPMLVLHGGYGIYFDRHSGNLPEQTMDQAPFAAHTFVVGAANGAATLQSPFVPIIPPPSAFPVFAPRTPTSAINIEATDPAIRDGMTQEYNLNVQYAPSDNWLAQVAYVGTQSTHRSGQVEFDQALLASPSNPVNGETTNSISNVTARLPWQGISSNSLQTNSSFIGNYNSLQASLRHRLRHGLELQAGYTWSKNLDEVNGEAGTDIYELQLPTNDQRNLRKSSYGLAGDDRDQRLVADFTWTTPRERSGPALVRAALSSWQVSGIGVVQTGNALSVFDTNAGSVYGLIGGEVRAQRTGSSPHTPGSLFHRVMSGYIDPAAFTRAPEVPNGTSLADQDFGNSGVGFLRGPGQHNVDMAVERIIPLTESHSVRFRTEFFNLTNTPQFGNPNTTLGYADPTQLNPVASPSFGRITSTVTAPRIIQFAIRYAF